MIPPQQFDFHTKEQLCDGLEEIRLGIVDDGTRQFCKAILQKFGATSKTVKSKARELGVHDSHYACACEQFIKHQVDVAKDDFMDDDRMLSRIKENGDIDPAWVNLHSKRLEGLLKVLHGNKIQQTNTNINIDAGSSHAEIAEKLGADVANEIFAKLLK